jgi:signal transduction histidine kinase
VRWSIRNQILLPFVGILMLAVTLIAITAAWLAARRSEQQTIANLRDVAGTLGRGNYPYSAAVLEQMRGLSGAHFVWLGGNGEVLASTLGVDESSLPGDLRRMMRDPEAIGLARDDHRPKLAFGGQRFFVAALHRPSERGETDLLVLYPEAAWSRIRWDAALPPLAVGAGAILLTAAVAGWLAQRFSSRLRHVETQVAVIAAGDLTREIQEPPGLRVTDELHELVGSVNRMRGQLQAMQQTIRQIERTHLLAQVAGGLAHQLRNAVTGARLALQIHRKRCRGEATPSEAAESSLDVALRQLALTEEQVKGLLSLGRMEQRPPADCDLAQLVREVVLFVTPACEHSHAKLTSTCQPDTIPLRADVDGLRAALLNLTLNAIEAAGPGGDVRLDAALDNGYVRVDVSDNGSGPPADLASSLFDPFVTSKPEGVGLGLALSRQVATDHGGSLAWSREEGYTRFRLTIRSPLAPEGGEGSGVRGERFGIPIANTIQPHSAPSP